MNRIDHIMGAPGSAPPAGRPDARDGADDGREDRLAPAQNPWALPADGAPASQEDHDPTPVIRGLRYALPIALLLWLALFGLVKLIARS